MRTLFLLSLVNLCLSIFALAFVAIFLYESKIMLIDQKLMYLQVFIVVSCFNAIFSAKITIFGHLRYIFSFFSLTVLLFGFYIFDSVSFFHLIADSWYKETNFNATLNIQKVYKCCNYMTTVIDSHNECHHGFSANCLSLLYKSFHMHIKLFAIYLIFCSILSLLVIWLK